MKLPPIALLVIILIIGFLSSSTVYFYNKSQNNQKEKTSSTAIFSADTPQLTLSESAKKVDELTKPADPKGRLSYPANVYTVETKETLFGIGNKFGIDWRLIKLASGVINENLIQAGYTLIIPKMETSTDLYRINFKIDEERASQLNRDLRDKASDALFNPIEVTKKDAIPYFGITAEDEFILLEQDESRGTALVQVKNSNVTNVVGLFQPKEKGKKGFWAVLYVENR